MFRAVKSFNESADPAEYLERARGQRDVLEHIKASYKNLVELFNAGAAVSSREFSAFIDLAERARIVNREGMKASGFYYVMNEDRLRKMGRVVAKEAMPAADHIMMQVDRTIRILNRKPGAYNPARSPLYGTALKDWTPLLP